MVTKEKTTKPRKRTKKATSEVTPKVVPEEYKDADGTSKLPETKFWKWKALHGAMALHIITHQKAKDDFESIVARSLELSKLKQLMASSKAELALANNEYVQLLKEIEEATGLDLKKCSVDDQNGKIFELDATSEP